MSSKPKNSRIRLICLSGICCALICVLAPLSIPGTIPITLSVFAVLLVSCLLPVPAALASVICYLILGAVGLPVFSGFRGGFGILTGVTGGYIFSYPLMALVQSLFCRIKAKYRLIPMIGGGLVAIFVCYAVGTAWFCHMTGSGLSHALAVCVVPFIPFDVLKAAAAALLADRLAKPLGLMPGSKKEE